MRKKILSLLTTVFLSTTMVFSGFPVLADTVASATTSTVSNFQLSSYPEFANYNVTYKIQASQISTVTNNGGNYGTYTIGKLNDGTLDTFWETGTANSATFKNEVVVTFAQNVDINRIAYATRQDGAKPKGFPTSYEIYGNTDGSNNYTLAAAGAASATSNMVEIKFAKNTFKKLKFVFVGAYNDWASASELWFYKEDAVSDQVKTLFTDNTHSKLVSTVTAAQITALETSVATHPLKNYLSKDIADAKKLIQNPTVFDRYTFTAEQKVCPAVKAGVFPQLSTYQATGLYAIPTQTVNVYVEANTNGPLPSIVFTQNQGSWNIFARSYNLSAGMNTITVPEIYDASWTVPVKKGGPIYIVNYYSSTEQPVAPKIRIDGAATFPLFKEGGNEQSFINELTAYNTKLDADNAAGTNQVLDIVEVSANNMLLTTTTKSAVEAYITNTVKPSQTTAFWNSFVMEECRLAGMDGSSAIHDATNIKTNIRLMQPFGYMYAAGNHIGVQSDVKASMLMPEIVKASSWGYAHELGHQLDNSIAAVRTWGEVTNNVQSANMLTLFEGPSSRIPYEEAVYPNVAPVSRVTPYDGGAYFENLSIFWQLQLHNNNYWANINKLYRERRPSVSDEQSKRELFIKYSSEVLNLNLGDYFKRHGWEAGAATLTVLAAYPTPTKKLWYLSDLVAGYTGTGLTTAAVPSVTATYDSSTNKVTLGLSMDPAYRNDLLGYEILKGGQVIGFTSSASFTHTNTDVVNSGVYEVRTYDKKLNQAGSATVKVTDNSIILKSNYLTLKLNETFTPLSYAVAKNYLGTDLSSQLQVVSNNVNTALPGSYKVTYGLNGIQKDMIVNVVNNYNYLSDLNWSSATVGWGTIRKDKSIDGNTLTTNNCGKTFNFAKGIGTHAKSTIVYNLTNTNYIYFESLVGVDKESGTAASVGFEVWTDGIRVFNSGTMNVTSNPQYVKVPLTGVKELKLIVTDAGNGNGSDHADWLDSKLIPMSTPVLNYQINKTFTGTEYTDISSNISTMSALTEGSIVAKFSTTSTAVAKTIFSMSHSADSSSNMTLALNGGALHFENRENGVYATNITTTQTNYNNGTNHVVVLNVSSAGTSIFVDGVKVSSGTSKAFGTTVLTPNAMYLGRNLDKDAGTAGQWYFVGNISYVQIYNKALTNEEIANLR